MIYRHDQKRPPLDTLHHHQEGQNYFGNLSDYFHHAQDNLRVQQSRLNTLTSNVGKGPRGYQRSDERLKEIACERLCNDPLIDASDMEVTVTNSEVRLSGTVPDRSTKRRAEYVVEGVVGITQVENCLRISEKNKSSILMI